MLTGAPRDRATRGRRPRRGALVLYVAAVVVGATVAAMPVPSAGARHETPVRRASARAPVVTSAHREAPLGIADAVVPIDAPHGRLSSAYGYRMSNRSRRRRFHAGVDFEAPRGARVHSVRAGRVEAVPRNRERRTGFDGYGNAVIVRHDDDGVWVLYAHLESVAVRPGDRVGAGTLLGTAGRTSNRKFPSMAPHLHLEVRVATPEGTSPFPGQYRRHNVNPRCWLARHGLYYTASGELGARAEAPLGRCRR